MIFLNYLSVCYVSGFYKEYHAPVLGAVLFGIIGSDYFELAVTDGGDFLRRERVRIYKVADYRGGAGGGQFPVGAVPACKYRHVIGVALHKEIVAFYFYAPAQGRRNLIYVAFHLGKKFGAAGNEEGNVRLFFKAYLQAVFCHLGLPGYGFLFHRLLDFLVNFLQSAGHRRGERVNKQKENGKLGHQVGIVYKPRG